MHGATIKNIEFDSKNKFEKLVQLVCFIIRIYHDARSSECQTRHCVVILEVPVTANTVPFVIINLYGSENTYWARNVHSAHNRPSHHFIWCSQTKTKFSQHACRQ